MVKDFCILPFINLDIQPSGDVYVCCHSSHPESIGNLHKESLKEIWDSKKLAAFRKYFLENKKSASSHCKDCFYNEGLGVKSWRIRENENWGPAVSSFLGGSQDLSFPKSLALSFSNRCNFSCRSCRPSTSTAWFLDAKILNPAGEYKELHSAPKENPLSKQIQLFIPNLEHINFSGGEPLMNADYYKVINKIIEGNSSINISYDTNLSILGNNSFNAIEQWKSLENLTISCSLDGIGEKGEYLRKGLKWDLFLKNWNKLKKEVPHASLEIKFTLSIYNMLHVLDFISEVKRLKLFSGNNLSGLKIGALEYPHWLSLQALEHKAKNVIHERYAAYIKNDIDDNICKDLEAAVCYMMGEDKSEQLVGFKKFTEKIDILRDENYSVLFPQEWSLLTND